jgi:uncharacterized protein (TIGR02246 family)
VARKDIEAAEAAWLTAFNGGDASGVAQLYAEEARLLPPNTDIVAGRPAIEGFVKEFLAMGATLSFELVAVHDAGDLNVAVGRYQMELRPPGAEPQQDNGKFVEVWTRQADGSWQIVDDIFNSSLPAPG